MKMSSRSVKKYFVLFALAAGAALLPQNAFAVGAIAQQIQGEVLVHKIAGPADSWATVTQDTALASGDSIKTRKGTCALVYGDQATFNMLENTALTVEETATAQDLRLEIGKIKGKVNHDKVTLPFEVVTPAAVATVRGTEVDFGFNDQGQLTVDLHNGNIDVVNEDAQMKLNLNGKKSITLLYDKESNMIHLTNDCGSDGSVSFNVLGADYSAGPCEQKEVSLSTAEQGTTNPETSSDPDDPENPDAGRRVTDAVHQ